MTITCITENYPPVETSAEWRNAVLDGEQDRRTGRDPKLDISDHGPDTVYADGYGCGYMSPGDYTFIES